MHYFTVTSYHEENHIDYNANYEKETIKPNSLKAVDQFQGSIPF